MNVAIIPARAGSSRIPKKNIKEFFGKPIISYPINAAKESGVIDKVIVSTDSEEFAEIAREWGAEVPFLRPKDLGENKVNVADVVFHAVDWLKKNGEELSYVCCLVATAPFLKPEYLAEGYELINKNDVDSVVSVVKFPFPIQRAFKMTDNEKVKFMWPEHEFSHSNNLPQAYHDAAQFYWLDVNKFVKSKSLMGKEVIPVIIPEYLAKDIDTSEDWEMAEIMYEACQKRGWL